MEGNLETLADSYESTFDVDQSDYSLPDLTIPSLSNAQQKALGSTRAYDNYAKKVEKKSYE